jgi:hypothetical protein
MLLARISDQAASDTEKALVFWSKASPHFSPRGEMITQRFVFKKDFMKEWNNSVYFRLNKILCGFKDQVRARPSGEKCGLG